MNPVDFIFSLFGPFFQLDPTAVEKLHQSATDWYEQSPIKSFIEKYWFIPLILPLVYPFVTKYVNKLYDSVGDNDQDGDIDLADIFALLQKKFDSKGV